MSNVDLTGSNKDGGRMEGKWKKKLCSKQSFEVFINLKPKSRLQNNPTALMNTLSGV